MSEENETKEKPGFKTSEFWICLLVLLLGALVQSGALGEGHWALKAIAFAFTTLGALGYTAARAKAKFGASMERAALGKSPASE